MPSISNCRSVELSEGQKSGKKIIAQLDECDSREKAGEYVQHDIFIRRSELPELVENEFYWIDLEGLQVVNQDRQTLGIVSKVLATGANDVLVVRANEQDLESEEILIPYVEGHYVVEVNIDEGFIQVDWEL